MSEDAPKKEPSMATLKIVMDRPPMTPAEQEGFLNDLAAVVGGSREDMKNVNFTKGASANGPKAVFHEFMDHTSGSSFEPGGLRAEFETVCTVVALIPEFHQVEVRDDEGFMFTITENTPGVDYADLKEGQKVTCSISSKILPRVLFAELVP